MAITKTIISSSPARTVIKVTATAAGDTTTIKMKGAATPTAITATFSAANKTITRASGSWAADFGAPVGANVVINFVAGTTLNIGTFAGVITSPTVITATSWYSLVDETSVAISNTQWSGYWSDLASPSQQLGPLPLANITKVWYSVSSSGDVTITRNSVAVLKLFGHDVIDNFGLAENNSSDVVATFNTSAGGTVILEFSKIDGFLLTPSQTAVGS